MLITGTDLGGGRKQKMKIICFPGWIKDPKRQTGVTDKWVHSIIHQLKSYDQNKNDKEARSSVFVLLSFIHSAFDPVYVI